VPEAWDPACYRERAKAWRDKATVLPDDDRGCVKTQFAPGGEQHRVATEVLRERRMQGRVTSHSEIAYCRYGSTFSHSLDPERAVCIVLADGYDRLATLLEQRTGRPT
jgi:hypothetical protein